jgi:hypothetical protein
LTRPFLAANPTVASLNSGSAWQVAHLARNAVSPARCGRVSAEALPCTKRSYGVRSGMSVASYAAMACPQMLEKLSSAVMAAVMPKAAATRSA